VALPAILRTASALLIALRYLGLLCWPTRLSYDHSYAQLSPIESFSDPRLFLVLGFLLVIGAGLWLSLRASRPLFFAISFYIITFALVSNVGFSIGTIMGERLVYLPSVGFLLAVTLIFTWPFRKRPRRDQQRWLLLLALPLIVALGWRSTVRNGDWVSEEDLFLHDLAVSPGSAKVRTNAGIAYARLGRHEEALEQYAVAAEIGLTPLQYPTPYLGAVRSLYNLQRYGAAVALYREVVQSGVRSQEIEDVFDQLRRDWRAPP
jgi:tetratricopeptide (TPR) repeat protein